jgi:acetoin utilization deacetylase AcuC-like enzyme
MGALERTLPDLHEDVLPILTEPALEPDLEMVHTHNHIGRVRSACEHALETGQIIKLDADTVVSPGSWNAALAAVGCGLAAVRDVLSGRQSGGFCPIRPPGHHATQDRAMGFCLFNNVALAARRALANPSISRVLIADWDVHHGNGTQDIFYEDPSVFFFSMHQSPLYPGTGASTETGYGSGEGFTRNLPMAPGLPSSQYVRSFLEGLDHVLNDFKPDFVLISAGFDAGIEDPLGGFTLEQDDFSILTRAVVEKTRATAHGRVVSFLEGGYNSAELGRNVASHLTTLRDVLV